jgi:cell division protein WhiA
LEHPDASLAELARLGGIGKSAANHRLRRLLEIGDPRDTVGAKR